MNNTIKTISAIIGILVVIIGVMWKAELRYAKAVEIEKTNQLICGNSREIQIIRLETQLRRVYDRIWMIEQNFGIGCASCPSEYLNEYNKLKLDVEDINRRLKQLDG